MPRRLAFLLAVGLHPLLSQPADGQARPLPPTAGQRATDGLAFPGHPDLPELLARREVSPRAAVAGFTRTPDGRVLVGTLARVTPEGEAQLRALGAQVGLRAGEWVVARIPAEQLGRAARLPGVVRLELAGRARPTLDSALIDVGAVRVRSRAFRDEYRGATGKGTIVGIIDTGLDHQHPDFRDDLSGQSRVLSLWDQTLGGNGPGVVGGVDMSYGHECTRSTLTTGQCPSRDTDAHGSHVAGIAAGDGSAWSRADTTGYRYSGVAPEADLIVVKTDFSFIGILEGVYYVFVRAMELQRPAVVNLSLGTQLGPHDGNEAVSLILDELSGPGRIVVASAGNEGDNHTGSGTHRPMIHGEGTAAVGDSVVLTFNVGAYSPFNGPFNDILLLQAFYSPTDSFDITLERPNGTRVTVPTAYGTAQSNDPNGGVVLYTGTQQGDSILIDDLELTGFAPDSPLRTATIYAGEWLESYARPAAGAWKIVMRRLGGTGSGRVDAYVSFSWLRSAVSFAAGGTNNRLVGTPADARSVIAVGAYVTLRSWEAVDGNQYTIRDGLQRGELLGFSSPGPTLDGRLKPDISAPGRVFSSLSSHAGDVPQPLVAPGGRHVLLQGTSMSSPLVAGTVALLLEQRPTLTPSAARQVLQLSARRDAFAQVSHTTGDPGPFGGMYNPSWGAGKLDVPAALERLTGRSATPSAVAAVHIPQNPVRVSPLTITTREPLRQVDVYDFAGRRVAQLLPTTVDPRGVRWDLRNEQGQPVAPGAYVVVVDVPSGVVRRKIFIVR